MIKSNEFNAQLIDENNTSISVNLKLLSKYHLMVTNLPSECEDIKQFTQVKIFIDNQEFELGACKIIKKSFSYELFFIDNVYDFEFLLEKNALVDLSSHFHGLSLVFNQQKKIKENFKEYVSRINYEINCYKQFFDQFERNLPTDNNFLNNQLQLAVINSDEGKKFYDYFDATLDELKELVKNFTKEEHQNHGFYLRKQVRGIIRCSDLVERTNIKPRGYAGDSEMMRMIYENGYRGRKIFEKLFYHHALKTDTSQAVRNRVKIIPEILLDVKKNLNVDTFRFLSVACGPAHELKNIFSKKTKNHEFEPVLLDQDQDALNEAEDTVMGLEKKLKLHLDATYIEESVRTLIRNGDNNLNIGKFHFIYSMGLFDYLTPLVARAILSKLFSLLHPDGELLIGNFHVNNSQRWYMSYWMDWELFYRTKEEFLNLLVVDDCAHKEIIFEETGNQMFLRAKKK